MEKKFPLRTKSATYEALEKEAGQKKWSVNTLINDIIEAHQKNNKEKRKKGLVISK